MIHRRPLQHPLRILASAFCVLIVSFGVLCGASALAGATGDAPAASFMARLAEGCLVLLAIDVLLLVGVLAIRALDEHDEP